MTWEEIWYQKGKVAMSQWFTDRLISFVRDHPDTLAATPMALRDHLAAMIQDGVREAIDGTRTPEPLQVSA